MEKQCSKTSRQQGGGNTQTGQNGDQDGGAKHRKQMLNTQHQGLRNTQLSDIVDGLNAQLRFLFCHSFISSHNKVIRFILTVCGKFTIGLPTATVTYYFTQMLPYGFLECISNLYRILWILLSIIA